MSKLTKKQKLWTDKIDSEKLYNLDEAIKLAKELATSKFDESVELSLNLGVDPKHADQTVRAMTSLPHGSGKSVRVAVFARDDKAEEAKAAGADIVGAEDLVETVQKGTIDFDRCIATPDMMALVGRLGKILGTKGMMPNPKLGTVTPDVTKAVTEAKAGSIEFRAEKAGIVQAAVGKASFDEKKLKDNVLAFVQAVQKAKPTGAKGTFIQKVVITTTMGPGIKLDIESMQDAA